MSEKVFNEIISQLEKLNVEEVVKLISTLEERWGVSAAAAVAAGPVAGPAAEEEDSEKEVLLTEMGEKIKTIKAIREIDSSLSLMDAKKAVESISAATPHSLGKFEKSKADELMKKFQELGTAPKLG